MNPFWSPLVQELTPYTPGEQPKTTNLIKLNTNENPYGPSARVLQALRSAVGDSLRLYPDPEAEALRQTVARHHGLAPDEVFAGNTESLISMAQKDGGEVPTADEAAAADKAKK